jgi:hypothetical protein
MSKNLGGGSLARLGIVARIEGLEQSVLVHSAVRGGKALPLTVRQRWYGFMATLAAAGSLSCRELIVVARPDFER